MNSDDVINPVLLFACAAVCGLALTPLARAAARRVGLVDRPDGRRKIHDRAVPLSGGIAVFVTTVLVLLTAVGISAPVPEAIYGQSVQLLGLLVGSAMICGLGVVDDFRQLAGRYKLLGQLAAVGVVVSSGTVVHAVAVFGWHLPLGALAVPFTVFFLLGAINALNLLDGMDGLLGTVGLIICAAIAVLAAIGGNPVDAAIAAALAGALVGFLRYNLPPASLFMGDAGSMLVGLVIGVLAIRTSLKGTATVALAVPAALLAIPIIDTAAALVRRKFTGRSIYSTDRAHLHHCLLRSGLSRPKVLALVGGLCLLTVLGAVGVIAYQSELLAILSVGTVVATLVATRLFGHAEFILLVKSVKGLARSVWGRGEDGHEMQVRLQGTAGWGDLWARLTEGADRLGLRTLALDVNAPTLHEGYHARWHGPRPAAGEEPGVWSAELPLKVWGQTIGQVTVTGRLDGVPLWHKLETLMRVMDDAEAVVTPLAPSPVIAPPLEPIAVGVA